jgi:plasmid stabilization system protein ParE
MSKTTFVAVSPLTGKKFTRKSERQYTFAVICSESIEAQRQRSEADAKYEEKLAAQYHEIATFLETGTTPDATHRLRQPKPRSHFSWAEYEAGVRTKWDSILYHATRDNETHAQVAANYRRWASNSQDRANKLRAEVIDRPREGASFHHSEALARKEQAKDAKYWTQVVVVPCVTD